MYPKRSRGLVRVLALPALLLVAADPAVAKRTFCVHGLEPPAELKVRSGPGDEAAVVGAFPAKACGITLAGRCEGHWCQMQLGRSFGWVDTRSIGVYELPATPRAATVRPATKDFTPPQGPQVGLARVPSAGVVTAPGSEAQAAAAGSGDPGAALPDRRIEIVRRPVPRARPRAQARATARPVPRSWWPAPIAPIFGFAAPSRPARSACVVDVERWDTLRIRSGPGVQHREIGEIPPRACGVVETGGCYGRWCLVAWRGQQGWVNTRYLE